MGEGRFLRSAAWGHLGAGGSGPSRSLPAPGGSQELSGETSLQATKRRAKCGGWSVSRCPARDLGTLGNGVLAEELDSRCDHGGVRGPSAAAGVLMKSGGFGQTLGKAWWGPGAPRGWEGQAGGSRPCTPLGLGLLASGTAGGRVSAALTHPARDDFTEALENYSTGD